MVMLWRFPIFLMLGRNNFVMRACRVVLLLFLILLVIMSCQEAQISREQVLMTLDSLQHKLEWLDYRIAQESWDLHATGSSDSLAFYRGLSERVVADAGASRTLSAGGSLVDDEIDSRRLDIISGIMLIARVETASAVRRLRDSLNVIQNQFQPIFDGTPVNVKRLRDILSKSSDRSRRERAYRAWCSSGDGIDDGLATLFRLRNQEAKRAGFNNFFAMSFSANGMAISEHVMLINHLDSLSNEPYRAVLDRIQRKLGRDNLKAWDIDYAYADVHTDADKHFPADSQLAIIKRSLTGLGFDIDKLPIYFDPIDSAAELPFAEIYPIRPPYEVRILIHSVDGLESTQELMKKIGQAIHLSQITQNQQLFIYRMDPDWIEGMGQMFASLLMRPSWLIEYAGMSASLAEGLSEARHDEGIVKLRTQLLQMMFEYQAYLNPDQDLGKLYWDLYEQYLMLPRHDEIQPWAGIVELTSHPIRLQQHLIADMIAAQSAVSLEKAYGEMIDNSMAGSFLVQNYFRFGARYSWRDLLKRGTDEELNYQYLLDDLGI